MFTRVVLIIFWIILIIVFCHLIYRKITHKIERAINFPNKIPKWIYPFIPICLAGYLYICILTIIYIFDSNLAFNLFLPIEILNFEVLKYIGDLFVLIGTTTFFTAYYYLNSIKNIRDSNSFDLKTSGIYAISRNPIYLGMHIFTIGFCLIIPTWITIPSTIIFIINIHYRIKLEEKELEELFGNTYIKYKRNVFRYFGRRINR